MLTVARLIPRAARLPGERAGVRGRTATAHQIEAGALALPPAVACAVPPSPAMRERAESAERLNGLSARVSRRAARPDFAAESGRPARPADAARARIRRPLPVPQRKDAVLLRRRGQGLLSLLRLRRAWRRDRLCHARRQSRFSRGGRAPGRRGRARGAAGNPRRSASGRSARRRCSRRSTPPPHSTRRGCGRRPARAPATICAARGLDEETIRRFRLGWAPRTGRRCAARSPPSFRSRCCSRPGCCATRKTAAAVTIISAAG